MAQYVMNAYDADVFIPEFRGLMQDGDQMQSDLRYSPNCCNIETPGGVLQPSSYTPATRLYPDPEEVGDGTLMYIRHNAYSGSAETYIGGQSRIPLNPYYECDDYLVVREGKMYRLRIQGDAQEMSSYTMDQVAFPTGVTEFKSNQFDWTSYEVTVLAPVQPDPSKPQYNVVNVLIFANKQDGVFLYNGTMTKLNNNTNLLPNFSCVARYAERIWGANGNQVFYSKPFKADDWEADQADVSVNGGYFRLATYDDDEIIAMHTLGDSLILFSKKRAWKLSGSNPTDFMVQEQYGNGCPFPQTIAEMDNRIIMMGEDGLLMYDGYQTQPFLRSQTKEIFREIKSPDSNPKAVRIGDKYLIAMTSTNNNRQFEIKEYDSTQGNGWVDPDHAAHEAQGPSYIVKKQMYLGRDSNLIIYDSQSGSVTARSSHDVISFCKGTPYFLTMDVFLVGTPPVIEYANFLCKLNFDSWYSHESETNAIWVSPWITFNRQDIKKGGFEFYFTPEIEPALTRKHQYWEKPNPIKGYPVIEYNDPPETYSVTLQISIQTEKKTKTKNYTINNLSASEILAGKQYKMKRLHFGGAGRRFRVIIKEYSRNNATWRLVGGIHIVAEMDKD